MKSIEAATEIIDVAIEAQQGPLPPTFLVEFVLGPWRAHLSHIHSEQGEASKEWSDAAKATNLLLWSVAPKLGADRQTLADSGELLLADQSVMDEAGWLQSDRATFLTELDGGTSVSSGPGGTLPAAPMICG
ncbi:MAG: DUF1631 family protein [Gammaproteobacteria bacterium]